MAHQCVGPGPEGHQQPQPDNPAPGTNGAAAWPHRAPRVHNLTCVYHKNGEICDSSQTIQPIINKTDSNEKNLCNYGAELT